MSTDLRDRLVKLLTEAGQAHHDAFAATNGEDADWPVWYANYLQAPLEALGIVLDRGRIAFCLIAADTEHRARAPEAAWPDFYADHMIERYAASDAPAGDTLALYHFQACPFCALVRAAIDRLGIDVELRDISAVPQHRDDLVAARQRATVPVLRITSADGEDRWMPESRDIVRYLEQTYG